MAWNPTNSTQLVAACDHQLSPTLHRWDLRSPNMPFELLGHDQVSPAAAPALPLAPPTACASGRRARRALPVPCAKPDWQKQPHSPAQTCECCLHGGDLPEVRQRVLTEEHVSSIAESHPVSCQEYHHTEPDGPHNPPVQLESSRSFCEIKIRLSTVLLHR